MGQLTWTHLLQGFKNSPTIFDEALQQDLAAFPIPRQYVDDLLAASSKELCLQGTNCLLMELGELEATMPQQRKPKYATNRSVTWGTYSERERDGCQMPEKKHTTAHKSEAG